MTTASTTTAINHGTAAGFQAWYNEVITELLAVGLTQTTDTGQIGATASLPGTNTSAGYTIWKFNDTLQSTAPLFLKLEFGTGSSAGNPQMWMTFGTGSNGAGTLTGTVSTRVECMCNVVPVSTTNLYVSRFMYSATLGICWVALKYGSESAAQPNQTMGGFILSRSNSAAGASNGDGFFAITNSSSASGGSNTNNGCMQCISNLTSTVYPSAIGPQSYFFVTPFLLASNAYSGNVQVYPVFYMAPLISISANVGVANMIDITLGGTFSGSLVGSTSVTFIQAGEVHGTSNIGASTNQAAGQNAGFILPWQ